MGSMRKVMMVSSTTVRPSKPIALHREYVLARINKEFGLGMRNNPLRHTHISNRIMGRLSFRLHVKNWPRRCNYSTTSPLTIHDKTSTDFLRDKKIVPQADPPSTRDINLLYDFFQQSQKLMVLTGAGISTESGIPDYRSPNGAYSSGFKPITHQEFLRSSRARKRYWARSYAGWRRFTAAEPSSAHRALASLEKVGRIDFIVTQNVDRLHHRAGSDPLELHGTVYSVVCLQCGASVDRSLFQDEVKVLNPKWAAAIESIEHGSAGSEKSFGMKLRPDADVEIDEKFWEDDLEIPNCRKCNGLLKPDVVFFGDNVPKDRAIKAMEATKQCDSFLVLGSSLMTFSAFRLARAAFDAGAAVGIVNVGKTRADDFVPLKINARVGEVYSSIQHHTCTRSLTHMFLLAQQILPRVIEVGCLTIPCILT